jgi:hypothetical protein
MNLQGATPESRMTLAEGFFRRICVGRGEVWILEDTGAGLRAGMVLLMGLGVLFGILGIVVLAQYVPAMLYRADDEVVGRVVLGVVLGLAGLLGLGYGGHRLASLERGRSQLIGFSVVGRADTSAGMFTDRWGASFPLACVQPILHRKFAGHSSADRWTLVLAWPGRCIDICAGYRDWPTNVPEARLLKILDELHRLGFARGRIDPRWA